MKYYWFNRRVSPVARGFVITNKAPNLGVVRNKLTTKEVVKAIFWWSKKKPNYKIVAEFK